MKRGLSFSCQLFNLYKARHRACIPGAHNCRRALALKPRSAAVVVLSCPLSCVHKQHLPLHTGGSPREEDKDRPQAPGPHRTTEFFGCATSQRGLTLTLIPTEKNNNMVRRAQRFTHTPYHTMQSWYNEDPGCCGRLWVWVSVCVCVCVCVCARVESLSLCPSRYVSVSLALFLSLSLSLCVSLSASLSLFQISVCLSVCLSVRFCCLCYSSVAYSIFDVHHLGSLLPPQLAYILFLQRHNVSVLHRTEGVQHYTCRKYHTN